MTGNTVSKSRSRLPWWAQLALAALTWWLAVESLMLGSRWDSVVHPTPGVRIWSEDAGGASGTLIETWAGDWILESEDGTRTILQNLSTYTMIFPPVAATSTDWMAVHWRAIAPPALYLLAVSAYIGVPRLRKAGPRERRSQA